MPYNRMFGMGGTYGAQPQPLVAQPQRMGRYFNRQPLDPQFLGGPSVPNPMEQYARWGMGRQPQPQQALSSFGQSYNQQAQPQRNQGGMDQLMQFIQRSRGASAQPTGYGQMPPGLGGLYGGGKQINSTPYAPYGIPTITPQDYLQQYTPQANVPSSAGMGTNPFITNR